MADGRQTWGPLQQNHAVEDSARVSVVVPSHNHAGFVRKCLESIFNQTLTPKELLVIDDGSHDDSPKVIESALRDCPFEARLVTRENRGLCSTLNEGLAGTSGEFFAYIGSDDWWLPTFLEARTKFLRARPTAVLAYGHAYLADASDNITDCSAKQTDSWADYTDGNLTLPSFDVVHNRPITRLVLTGPRASFSRSA
jgi:glycosyltransferase involved in cell wall biosynthesis